MSGLRQMQGEKFADFLARVRAAQNAAKPPKKKPRVRKRKQPPADDTPFGQGDNLGESPD